MSGGDGTAAKATPIDMDQTVDAAESPVDVGASSVGEKRSASARSDAGDSGQGEKRRRIDVEALLKEDALSFTIFGIKPRLKEKQLAAILDAVPGIAYEKLKKAANIKVAKIRFAVRASTLPTTSHLVALS